MCTDYVCLTNIFMVGSMKVAHKYSILNRIGGGKFGQVFAGKNERTGEYVAIKMEPNSEYSLLKHESTILNYLYSKLCRNTPPVYWFGQYENPAISSSPVTALVIPLYTESFADFMNHRHHDHDHDDDATSSSMEKAMLFIKSAVLILKQIHSVGIVHRDIKPENWMFRISKTGEREMILLDFGLANFIENMEDETENRHIIGTPKYVSWFVHDGQPYGPRDDLLSVLYIALWMLYGDEIWNSGSTLSSSSSDIPKTDINHPLNLRLKSAKSRENIMNWVTPLHSETLTDDLLVPLSGNLGSPSGEPERHPRIQSVLSGRDRLTRMVETLYSSNIEYSYRIF